MLATCYLNSFVPIISQAELVAVTLLVDLPSSSAIA